jgi:3'-5' exoribonuclease
LIDKAGVRGYYRKTDQAIDYGRKIVMSGAQLQSIQEIKKLTAGSQFKAIFVATSLFQKTDKNGKPYYEISVSDSTGSIEAKIWSDAAWFDRSDAEDADAKAQARKLPDEMIKNIAGSTLGVEGKIAEYRGQLQFNFNKLTLLNQEKFPPARYLPRSPIPVEDLTSRFKALADSCRPEISAFLRAAFSGEIWRKFRDWPAAVSHHHAYSNGLIEHTVSVTECARSMAESLARSGYKIDLDIVVAGGLLHDIGKIDAYKFGAIPEMTLEGAVLDHVAIGYAKFMELAAREGLNKDVALQIAHILLSHHGQREFGSPVVPATPEAIVVASADELDFRVFCWNESIKDLTPDQPISQWHNGTSRRFWNRSFSEDAQDSVR